MSFALLSLALAILIWLACYGLLMLSQILGDFIDETVAAWLCFLACAALIIWGIWFIAHRWPAT